MIKIICSRLHVICYIFFERSEAVKKNDDIGYLIHQIDNRIKTNIDNNFKVHDLTFSQSQVLHLLEKNGGSMSQKQLQTEMNVSHPTMVGLVQRLESNSFVTTETDKRDRRNKIVMITEEALNFKNELIRSKEELHEAMFSSFTEDEMDTLKEMLHKILDNISGRKEE
ncbi:MAG: MarR family transcriptional regulator [Erysipelotrichaceae bacterium]|nr:MarR family transcriptional regulator [Erysipelotrichaceae bacterium]